MYDIYFPMVENAWEHGQQRTNQITLSLAIQKISDPESNKITRICLF